MADSNDVKIELGIKGPINDEDEIGSEIPEKGSLFKNKKCLIILISVISLIVIIVAVVVIVVLTKGKSNEKKKMKIDLLNLIDQMKLINRMSLNQV